MSEEDLSQFLEEQIALEKEIVEISKHSVETIKNSFVRELIRGIALDSKKHALLLTALSEMIEGPTPLIEEEDFDRIKASIEKHIQLEAKAIETYQRFLKAYEDNIRIKTVIDEIQRDEVRHHEFLLRLLQAIIDRETLTKDILEDWMFKFVPFHGSPGG